MSEQPLIRNQADLEAAIKAIPRAKDPAAAKAHVARRAKELGLTAVLPSDFTSEQPRSLSTTLVLEGEVPPPLIQERPSPENGGVMKLRVPFYMGNSVAKAPGIKKPIHFPADLLPAIVAEGKKQIAEGKQPITIYARHAHAADGGYLPIGAVVDLEQEGRIGYAIEEISPTTLGKDVQVLAENKHLNAVSLRSGAGRFDLKDVLVNEVPMFQPTKLWLDGIDFAPDGPAQATYGLTILQEDASVADDKPKIIPTRRKAAVSDLTLEALKADNPSLVAEIEAPLKRELATVTEQRDVLVSANQAVAREAKLREIAARFPDSDKALPILLELCKDCKTDDEVAAKAFPILLEALGAQKDAVKADPRAQLLELFPKGGRGQAIVQEVKTKDEIDPSDIPAGVFVAGV